MRIRPVSSRVLLDVPTRSSSHRRLHTNRNNVCCVPFPKYCLLIPWCVSFPIAGCSFGMDAVLTVQCSWLYPSVYNVIRNPHHPPDIFNNNATWKQQQHSLWCIQLNLTSVCFFWVFFFPIMVGRPVVFPYPFLLISLTKHEILMTLRCVP